MTPDSNGLPDPAQTGEAAAVGEAAETLRTASGEAASQAQQTTETLADGAQSVVSEGAEAADAASEASANAFDQARDRLNAMAESLPAPAQDVFRSFRTGSDALGKGFGSSYASALEGMAAFNSKAIEAWRSNAESTLRHWQSLAGVKSLSEAIALNAEHTRQQLETVTAQTRELSALATRIVRGAADPLKITKR